MQGHGKGRSSEEVKDSYGVGLFWKVIKNSRELVTCWISFTMGDGRRIKFWKDK